MRIPTAHGTLAVLLVAVAAARPARAQSLRGSPESVDRMYQEAQREALAFHETPREVRAAAGSGALVALTPSRNVTLRNVAFPYVTPATEAFVERLGQQHRAACGKPLMVTSAARPTTRQPRNSVAQSVHPTGMAVDLHKPSGRCLRWLRATLLEMEDAGALEATEEFHPPHFHVAVYPTAFTRYAAARPATPADAAERVASAVSTASVASEEAAAPRRTTPRAAREEKTRSAVRTASRDESRSRTRVAAAPRRAQRYRVRAGDTLWDLARARGVSVERILAANGMSRPVIRPGQRLVLPSAARTAPARQLSVADAVGQ